MEPCGKGPWTWKLRRASLCHVHRDVPDGKHEVPRAETVRTEQGALRDLIFPLAKTMDPGAAFDQRCVRNAGGTRYPYLV